jgi:cellulose synthase/poly-beta-1,6-N-acetylglucosamine synthase-like glycosyltransferase
MFALDYGVWFRTLLPGLDRIRAPIPLGGTSNHFRTGALQQAGGWDPFNVTEDADLGFRMARQGQQVSMLDSTTFEEAPVCMGPWLRQRTRWMKGYMQTMLVHSRQPGMLVRAIGWRGCLVMQAFLGGAIWSALVNPLLWIVFILSTVTAEAEAGPLEALAWTSGLTLLTANALLAALSLVDRSGRIPLRELPAVLTYPVYWMLISLAAYRALWQLVRDPFRWEKTPHGSALE